MLGLLGAAVFGVIFAGAWISADQTEQKSRESSRNSGRSFYYDKNGRMRHTGSGRKFTPQEIREFNRIDYPCPYAVKMKEAKKKKFYKVWCNLKDHWFLTKEEADKFYEENNKPENIIKYDDNQRYSKLDVGFYSEYGAVYHFDYDKYIGNLCELLQSPK